MAESSPELPKQRPKPQLPASALQDSSSPAPARRIKFKRIVSPAVPAQSAPAAKGHKKKTKRSAFVRSRFFDHQCVEKGKSDGSEGNSSDDGDLRITDCFDEWGQVSKFVDAEAAQVETRTKSRVSPR